MCVVIFVMWFLLWWSRFFVSVMCYVSRYFIGVMLIVWLKCLKNVECDNVVFFVSLMIVYGCVGCLCIWWSVVVRWLLVSLCMRLGDVWVLVVNCSVLISSIFSRCVSMILWVGCCVCDLLCISCMSVVSCGLLCMCMKWGSNDISSDVLGELKL